MKVGPMIVPHGFLGRNGCRIAGNQKFIMTWAAARLTIDKAQIEVAFFLMLVVMLVACYQF